MTFKHLYRLVGRASSWHLKTTHINICQRLYSVTYSTPETIKRGAENTFAYEVVKKAGIPDVFKSSPAIDKLSRDYASPVDLTELEAKLPSMCLEELVTMIPILDKRHRNSENFEKFFTALDAEGAKRVPSADPGVILAGAMRLYETTLFYKSTWVWACLKRFCRRPDRLTVAQMLQVMFLVNIMRRIPIQHSGFDVQHHLVPFFDQLTLDEMAVVSIAFFKSQTKMNNQVMMSKVLRRLLEECENCHNISMAMISKNIRYSLPLSLADELYMLQERLIPVVPSLDPKCLTHVMLTGTNVLVSHEKFLSAVALRVKECISQMRLKDFERLLLVLSMFNIRDDEIVQCILKEIEKRPEEVGRFPKSLICLVNYLLVFPTFHLDLVDRVLSKNFLSEVYGSNLKKIGGELIFIDQTIAIEQPHYKGNRLSQAMLKSSAKMMAFTGVSHGLSGTQRFSFELESVLGDLYGKEFICFNALLPHYHFPDLILGLDSNLRPVSPPSEWRVHKWGDVKRPPDDKNKWLVFIVGGWNTIIRNTNKPLGTMNAKIRQLKILGYHPILVPYPKWRESTDKISYVRSVIRTKLENLNSQPCHDAKGEKEEINSR